MWVYLGHTNPGGVGSEDSQGLFGQLGTGGVRGGRVVFSTWCPDHPLEDEGWSLPGGRDLHALPGSCLTTS